MVEKILNNTTPYGKIRASHEGSLHSYSLNKTTQQTVARTDINLWCECTESSVQSDVYANNLICHLCSSIIETTE